MSVKTIEQEQELCRRLVIESGMVPNDDNKDFQRELRRVCDEIFSIFEAQIVECGLRYLFIFSQFDQKIEDFRHIDGRTFVHVNTATGKKLVSIGIATEAVLAGHDYLVLVLLHELCHAFTNDGEHPAEWHAILDKMIGMYNKATGGHVCNDYDQLTANHASRVRHIVREEIIPAPASFEAVFRQQAPRPIN